MPPDCDEAEHAAAFADDLQAAPRDRTDHRREDEDGQPLGFIHLQTVDELLGRPRAHISDLTVSVAARGSGIGAAPCASPTPGDVSAAWRASARRLSRPPSTRGPCTGAAAGPDAADLHQAARRPGRSVYGTHLRVPPRCHDRAAAQGLAHAHFSHHRRTERQRALTGVAAVTSLIHAIVNANDAGWGAPSTWATMTVGGLLLVAFFVIEAHSDAPLVDLGLLRSRTVGGANLVSLIVAAALHPMFYFGGLLMQQSHGYSPLEAGAAWPPMSLLVISRPALWRPH